MLVCLKKERNLLKVTDMNLVGRRRQVGTDFKPWGSHVRVECLSVPLSLIKHGYSLVVCEMCEITTEH